MSYKTPIVQTPDFTLYLQRIEGTVWVHCDVRRWSHCIAKAVRAEVDRIARQVSPLFAMNEPAGDEKHAKFMRLMGFDYFKTLPGTTGQIPIYRRGQHGS